MARPIRRPLAIALLLILSALALPVAALADGQDVLDDFQDNGIVDGCYGREEFAEALELAAENDRLYGAAVEVIRDAQITNLEVAGEPCEPGIDAGDIADVDDDGGSGAVLWIVLGAMVVAAVVGGAVWARRGSGEA